MSLMKRGIAMPCFGSDPTVLIDLACDAENAGFDGVFLWDHMLFANSGEGPEILDPWSVLAVIASRTKRIRLGTIVTPVSRRRPWVLARQTTTIDRISHGRLILGVGIGSPQAGDFERFGEVSDPRERAAALDEGLAILQGLWSGNAFSFAGTHFSVDGVTFRPRPEQRPRIPIWAGGNLPAVRPILRAAHWDGLVPVKFHNGQIVTPTVGDISKAVKIVMTERGDLSRYDIAIWATIGDKVAADSYSRVGATWWIETALARRHWQIDVKSRLHLGV